MIEVWHDDEPPTLEMLNWWLWVGEDNLYWADRDFEDVERQARDAKAAAERAQRGY
jgi:hypothetical protein